MGTLRAILANSAPRHTLLLGKLAGGFLTVWIPFIVVFVLGLIVLGLMSFPDRRSRSSRPPGHGLLDDVRFSAGLLRLRLNDLGQLGPLPDLAGGDPSRLDRLPDRHSPAERYAGFGRSTPPGRKRSSRYRSRLAVENDRPGKSRRPGGQVCGIVRADHGQGGALREPEDKKKEFEAFQAEWDERASDMKSSQLREIDDSFRREKERQRGLAAGLSLLSPSAAFSRLDHRPLRHRGDRPGKLLPVRPGPPADPGRVPLSIRQEADDDVSAGGSGSSSSITKMVDLKTLPAFSVRNLASRRCPGRELGQPDLPGLLAPGALCRRLRPIS